MAFRKTIQSHYFPVPNSSGFGEVKFTQSSADGSSIRMARSFVDAESISKEALPLFSVSDVINSGQPIKGSVDFAPTDPAVRESRVATTAARYIESVQSSQSAPPSDSSNS